MTSTKAPMPMKVTTYLLGLTILSLAACEPANNKPRSAPTHNDSMQVSNAGMATPTFQGAIQDLIDGRSSALTLPAEKAIPVTVIEGFDKQTGGFKLRAVTYTPDGEAIGSLLLYDHEGNNEYALERSPQANV
ncbi:MAG: hypothetical protein ACFHXK_07100 [bacterium]